MVTGDAFGDLHFARKDDIERGLELVLMAQDRVSRVCFYFSSKDELGGLGLGDAWKGGAQDFTGDKGISHEWLPYA